MKQGPGGMVGGVRTSPGGAHAAQSTDDAARAARSGHGRRQARYSSPMRFGGQYVAKALPMIQSRGTGPQKRLSSDEPRLSPIMK